MLFSVGAICLAFGSPAWGANTYTAPQVWELMEPACAALGIDGEPCRCITDTVVAAHGEDAAAFVALEIWTRDDEAAALKATLGEDTAMAASELFDVAQNTQCANQPSDTGTSAGSASGAAIAGETPQ